MLFLIDFVIITGNSGGICDKFTLFKDGVGKSLNTGIITFQNYGSQVPSKVSHITFAHEVGHNFGSPVSFCFINNKWLMTPFQIYPWHITKL